MSIYVSPAPVADAAAVALPAAITPSADAKLSAALTLSAVDQGLSSFRSRGGRT